MPYTILDDVKKLLDKEVGDKKILEQIKRAAENNEAISNYERNYVAKLVDEYLRPPPPKPKPIPQETLEPSTLKEQIPVSEQKIVIPTIVGPKPRDKTNSKVIIGGGAIALAIIIAVVVGSGGIDFGSPTSPPTSPPTTSSGLLDLDQSSYNKGDIISISGKSKVSLGNTISLSIENADSELIWAEDIKIKGSGEYSTLAIAGGPGWEKSGIYTLKMEHGSEDEQITFSFKN